MRVEKLLSLVKLVSQMKLVILVKLLSLVKLLGLVKLVRIITLVSLMKQVSLVSGLSEKYNNWQAHTSIYCKEILQELKYSELTHLASVQACSDC